MIALSTLALLMIVPVLSSPRMASVVQLPPATAAVGGA